MGISSFTASQNWTLKDAEECYRIQRWGGGYYFVNERGHVAVRPDPTTDLSIDLYEVARRLKTEGIGFPVLLRFHDLLRSRVVLLNEAFRQAIASSGYQNRYVGVYPIKVNQLHEVVEEILEAGAPYQLGLECGSKAELVAALPHLTTDELLLICNGYKDEEMVQLILMAQTLGKTVIPVVEKYPEFIRLMDLGARQHLVQRFGVRIRIYTNGSGKWAAYGGDHSKFGISTAELLQLVDVLKTREHPEALQLLHFHLGSQIADIQSLRQGVREIARIYASLYRMGIPVRYLDVGGGLGINYEGGDRSAPQGLNYSLSEYVHSVVELVQEVCNAEEVPHPILISESGRAITAHHSVLLLEVLGATRRTPAEEDIPSDLTREEVVKELEYIWHRLHTPSLPLSELLAAYHELVEKRQQIEMLFSLGYLPLEQKALAEQIYWLAIEKLASHALAFPEEELPSELARLHVLLADQYLCNFSVFQSILDHWAIDQPFPIMPLHRLDERPSRWGTLVDLTCDSDGKINRFVAGGKTKQVLELHPLREGEPYLLGVFLVGAYQDIMGDMHNLFGKVTEVHIYADAEEPGNYYIEKVLPGATVEQILALVQYFPNDLERRMNRLIQEKVREGVIRPPIGIEWLQQYRKAFQSLTYLTPDANTY